MSRIGKLPVPIPKGVKIAVGKSDVSVEGPKGKLLQEIQPEIVVKIAEEQVIVSRKNDSKRARALHGLYRKLISNMIIGVTDGFSKTLLVNGVGYRVEDKGKSLLFSLGYSNPVEYSLEEGLTATLEGNNKLTLSGIDKQQVGQACAEIRSIRPPEPYKGKGVRYEGEYVRRKIGKAGIK